MESSDPRSMIIMSLQAVYGKTGILVETVVYIFCVAKRHLGGCHS